MKPTKSKVGYIPTPEERPDLYRTMLLHRLLPDGRLLYVQPLLYTFQLVVTDDIWSVDGY